MSEKDAIAHAKSAFALAADCEADNRAAALDDLRFARLSEQWNERLRKKREKDGRPCLTINRLPSFIRQVVNDARQNKPSIKVHAADSAADPETAEVFSGLIRNIEAASRAAIAYDTATDFAVTCGFGYFRIGTRFATDDSFDVDLAIERVANPFAVYGDPHGTAADSSDWNSAFVTELLPREEFRRRYKGAEEVDWQTSGYDGLSPPWRQEKQILVAEWWRREAVLRQLLLLSDGSVVAAESFAANRALYEAQGLRVAGARTVQSHAVTQQLMTGAEVLERRSWAGRYIPIVPVYGEELNVEGRRYFRSLVRDMKDAQRNYNYWRTASAELVALAPRAPFIGPVGAFETDKNKWETANTESYGYIEYDIIAGHNPPQRQAFAGVPAGALQEALHANDDMKAIAGMYDASLGAKSNETSGRAIMARQREGDVSSFHFIDNLSRAIEHGGRILIDLIPKVYSGARMIRVLGPEGEARAVQLGAAALPPGAAVPARIFDLSVGKYDLTVSAGPSFTSRREEAATQMMELIRVYPAAAPLIGDLLAKNLDWPGADEIARRLQRVLPVAAPSEERRYPYNGQASAARPYLSIDAAKNRNVHRLSALYRS